MIKKDFKQKYFLYCKDCTIDKILPQKFVQVNNKPYICRIKFEDVKL